jgi:hypothetical protein
MFDLGLQPIWRGMGRKRLAICMEADMSERIRIRGFGPRKWALAAVAALALAIPGSAQAGVLVASAPNCGDQALSQPFAPWLDPASYTLDNGGSFEGGASGWSLNGASVVSGNESYNVGGAGDSSSLSLPSGSSATSADICVGLEHPTLRIFARNSGSPLATLRVEVLFEDALGNVHSLTIGNVDSTSSWQPSLQMPVVANLLPLLPDQYTPVEFRFTPQGGNWQIDDVYVDPHHSG